MGNLFDEQMFAAIILFSLLTKHDQFCSNYIMEMHEKEESDELIKA